MAYKEKAKSQRRTKMGILFLVFVAFVIVTILSTKEE